MANAFKKFTTFNYAEQGKAFFNASWNAPTGESEKVWVWAHKFAELDLDKKKEGNDLDEFNAHRFLETVQETKTVRQMREEIREADLDFNKRLALIEYCLWKYKHSVGEFLKRPQGDNQEELKKAEKMLEEVQRKFDAVAAKAAEAKRREDEAKGEERKAHDRENEAKEREKEAHQREKEANDRKEEEAAAARELQKQEEAYKNKTEEIKARTETGGMVSKNKAKAELEIHLKEDPLPLRRAKITQEASARKAAKAAEDAAKAREAAQHARKQAQDARKLAQEARVKAEEATAAAERAVDEARESVRKAEEYLEEVRQQPGQPLGAIWWLERELAEKKKYLPQRKQG